MATQRGGAQDSIRILLELHVGDRFLYGNLKTYLVLYRSSKTNSLTGSSSALIASNGILIANNASHDEASR